MNFHCAVFVENDWKEQRDNWIASICVMLPEVLGFVVVIVLNKPFVCVVY